MTIWADADEAGYKYAQEVARLCMAAGVASVAIVVLPAGVAEGWDAADAEAEGWTNDQAARLIDEAKPFAKPKANKKAAPDDAGDDDNDNDKGSRRRRPPARDSLIALTEFCDFWHGPEGTAYVTFPVNAHRENWKVRSENFKRWLVWRSYEQSGSVPGGQGVASTAENAAWRVAITIAGNHSEQATAMRLAKKYRKNEKVRLKLIE